jgi:hypothetical protein
MRMLTLVATLVFSGAVGGAETTMADAQLTNCPNPPTGVIRFALLSDKNTADLYEWSGRTYRMVGTAPLDKVFFDGFEASSTYKWNYWGADAPSINRSAAGSGSTLSSPYSVSKDGKWLAAGLLRLNEKNDPPLRFVFLEVDTSRVVHTVEIGKSIKAMSLNPQAQEVVVLSETEKYVRKSLRQRFASAIGHPIPYSDITLTVVGLDGSSHCSITPARSLPYGNGLVRRDSDGGAPASVNPDARSTPRR